MLRHLKFYKHKFLFFLSIIPVFLPAFSAYALDNHQHVQIEFVAKLRENDLGVFSSDPLITEVRKVFVDSADSDFKRVVSITTTHSLADFISLYSDKTEYVQEQHRFQVSYPAVNDPGFTTDIANQDRQWGLVKAKFLDAWDLTTGKSSTVVAVLDTGIDATHEDLSSGQVGAGFDFVNRISIPVSISSDDNGHGTLVSGIIGATPNNFRGITGTNWNISLMPVKVLDSSGSGNSADVAAGIVWAADHGANIINMSLGGTGFANDSTLANAITYAFNKNVVLVAAAGNDVASTGGDLDQNPVFPICADNGQNMIIGVAATDLNDQKAQFSNYGRSCVDVSAPGKRILSTINRDPRTGAPLPNSYVYASGTSMATPFVSGEAALIKSLYPGATNKEIRDRIIKSADRIDALNPTQCGGLSCAGLIGSGRINAAAALQKDLLPTLSEGSLVQAEDSTLIYYISGGKKLPVSQFVLSQRFSGIVPKKVPAYLLDPLPTGPNALPNEGALVKSSASSTVYMITGGFKRPITYQIFLQRNLSYNQISELSDQEVNSWISSTLLPPLEGTLVKTPPDQTVYWVVDGLLHPISYEFWTSRGLNIFPIVIMSSGDLKGYAVGNSFTR